MSGHEICVDVIVDKRKATEKEKEKAEKNRNGERETMRACMYNQIKK